MNTASGQSTYYNTRNSTDNNKSIFFLALRISQMCTSRPKTLYQVETNSITGSNIYTVPGKIRASSTFSVLFLFSLFFFFF